MTTSANELRTVLVAGLSGVDAQNIHCYMIKTTDWTADRPVILITEISNNDVVFGSDDVLGRQPQTQVQVYYPPDYPGDMDELENNLKTLLRQNGWYCFSDTGHFISPDDQQIMDTMKFNRLKMEV